MIEISFKLYNTEEDRNIIILDKNNNHYIAYKYMENDMIVESLPVPQRRARATWVMDKDLLNTIITNKGTGKQFSIIHNGLVFTENFGNSWIQ